VSEERRIPANLIEAVNRLVRTAQRMFVELGRQPTAEELAERLAMPVAQVEKLLVIARAPVAAT